MPMDKGSQDALEQELRAVFQEEKADGSRRWSQEEVEDACALIIVSSVEGDPKELDETSKSLVMRFLERAELDSVTGEEFQARAKSYFDAHPVREDLVLRLKRIFEGWM